MNSTLLRTRKRWRI